MLQEKRLTAKQFKIDPDLVAQNLLATYYVLNLGQNLLCRFHMSTSQDLDDNNNDDEYLPLNLWKICLKVQKENVERFHLIWSRETF